MTASRSTIATRWEFEASAAACAVGKDGAAAVGTSDGELLCVGGDGKVVDTIRLKGPTVAGPTLRICEFRGPSWMVLRDGLAELVLVQGREQSAFAKAAGEIRDVCVCGDVVAVVRAECVELWTAQGNNRWRVEGGPFVKVAIVQKSVVALCADGTALFLNMMSGAVAGSVKLEVPEAASTWQMVPLAGTRFAMTLGEWLVIVDAAKEKVFRRTRLRANAISLAANERRIVAGLEDGWVQAVDTLTGDIRAAAPVHRSGVRAIALSGDRAVSASEDQLLGWDLPALSGAQTAAAPVTALTARGGILAVGDSGGKLRIQKGVEELANLRLDSAVSFVHMGANDTVVAVAASLLVRLPAPWTLPKPLVLESPCSAFCADDAYAFCGTKDGQVDVYDFSNSTRLTRYELTEGPISALHRPRGGLLAVGTDALDGRVFVVDLAEAKVLHRIEAHQEAFGVTALASEPRGRVLASGSDDGTVALIDLAKGKVLARVRVPEAPVSMAFDATGKRIAAVLADGTTVLIALDKKGAVTQLEAPKAVRVTWGDALAVGLGSGRVELLPVSA